ncbi:Uncharacterised protein [Vibrio cholerae]|nr:Uncharacterised protein [Vibrio cholerae]CSC66051.1 Uncharacterised protein [Vibrio cholerae]
MRLINVLLLQPMHLLSKFQIIHCECKLKVKP